MKTLLTIAKESGLAAAIGAVLDPEQYRVFPQEEVWQAEAVLRQGIIDACLLDAELTDIQPIRIIKQIRRLMPHCPILVYTANKQWEWEEEAYLLGVDHILAKPVRARLLNSLLERLWTCQTGRLNPSLPPPLGMSEGRARDTLRGPDRALEVLRDFSAILTHSLCSESLLKQFLLLLREILGVNRAAVFLRKPLNTVTEAAGKSEDRLLRPVCALGLAPELLEHFALSLESGIGRYAYRSGRILKNGSDEARGDLEAQKEFALLGAQVAIPILDRESLVGVAVFDGRLTGEFFANEELALIFHLLEGAGLAIKNSWLHDQLVSSHEMLADILDQLESGCVVVDRNLRVLHANPAAQKFFLPATKRTSGLEFRDLPQELGSQAFEALKTGATQPAFKYRPDGSTDPVYQIRTTAFKTHNSITANAVLLLVDNFTPHERVHQLEMEAARLRLIKSMASQLAHEIGNSMVPIRTYHELAAKKHEDPTVRSALTRTAMEGVRRISRLTNQMQFLADDALRPVSPISVPRLIREAILEAKSHCDHEAACLQCEGEDNGPPIVVSGDMQKLIQALSEIILNALQASPSNAPVEVRWHTENDAPGGRTLCIEIQDAGGGFTAQAAQRATEPFFSTRTVGLGLGLTVARKIIELHHGQLEISPAGSDQSNAVRVCLPLGKEAT